ncbi:MAG TPA: 5-formyltetrahydrofolate cyclo-ligase [Candidatus Megaira endosymbiont of Nemacystus decipiens]|nr:5-formyltetrahydrofolate cyclo-ligase [Candidatus Megaera endosymbiont of Nemacystus decipiens]
MKDKSSLRKVMLKSRMNFSKAENTESDFAISESLKRVIVSHMTQKATFNLGIYYPLDGEPNLINSLCNLSCSISLPKVQDDKMLFVKYKKDDELEKSGKLGIMQPKSNNITIPNLIIIPGLAFSLEGYRLGFGKGYYDRYLSLIEKKFSVYKIGVCYNDYLQEKIPCEPHDIKMNYIITNEIIIEL